MDPANRFRQWEEVYSHQRPEDLPWYNPELDHDFEKIIKELDLKDGRVLDAGAGPGTQAMQLSRMGFQVTATDISKSAIEQAATKAHENGVSVRFIQDDILDTKLTDKFDYIFDRGLFHVVEPSKRNVYVENIDKIIVQKGYLFLKCFSNKQPGNEGPYRVSPGDIRKTFEKDFNVISIEETTFEANRKPSPKALFSVLQKK